MPTRRLHVYDIDTPLPGAWCPKCRDHCAYTRRIATELAGWAQGVAYFDACPECGWDDLQPMAGPPDRG